MLESASLVIDGESQELFIPSGYQTGIKLVNSFTVDPAVITELTVDFDVASSLHEAPPGSGNYILRPTTIGPEYPFRNDLRDGNPRGYRLCYLRLEPYSGDTITTTLPDSLSGEYVLQAILKNALKL